MNSTLLGLKKGKFCSFLSPWHLIRKKVADSCAWIDASLSRLQSVTQFYFDAEVCRMIAKYDFDD